MTRFSDVDVFVAVAKARSFRAASVELGVSKSTVSRAIERLEAHVGAALVVRDRSGHRLTDAGESYLRYAEDAYRALTEGERAVAALDTTLEGTVRMSAPPALGPLLVSEVLTEFMKRYPQVVVELALSDAMVSLGTEPIDIAVRAGARLVRSNQRAHRLARVPFLAVATPGLAKSLDGSAPLIEVGTTKKRRRGTICLRVNDFATAKAAALQGVGVATLPAVLVSHELRAEQLVQVFPDWSLPTANYWAVVPRAGVAPRVAALLDHLKSGFARLAKD